jgi:hypothetical protein
MIARIAGKGVESATYLGRHRYVIERCLEWVSRFRRLARRYDRKASHFAGFSAPGLCSDLLPPCRTTQTSDQQQTLMRCGLTAHAFGERFKVNGLAPGLHRTNLIAGMSTGGDPAEAAIGAVRLALPFRRRPHRSPLVLGRHPRTRVATRVVCHGCASAPTVSMRNRRARRQLAGRQRRRGFTGRRSEPPAAPRRRSMELSTGATSEEAALYSLLASDVRLSACPQVSHHDAL